MANLIFVDPGGTPTQDFKFWTTAASDTGGAITVDAQSLFDSAKSIKAAGGASPGGASVNKTGILADAGRRFHLAMMLTGTLSVSGGVCGDFFNAHTSGGARVFGVGLNNSGKLILIHQNGTTVYGTGGTTLVASRVYDIEIVYTITSTTVNTITIYLNGIAEITVTNVTLATTGTDTV